MNEIWRPSDKLRSNARVTAYMGWLRAERGHVFEGYDALWEWSISDLSGFWSSIWDYFDIRSSTPYQAVLPSAAMPGAVWFSGASLNYVDQVFRHSNFARPAIIFRNESGAEMELGWRELERQVASVAESLRQSGVAPGDRVAAYLPNCPQTVVAFLAVASIGAIWSVCSPDTGQHAVLDRFRQIQPKVMIAVDGYRYGGKDLDRRETLTAILDELPSVETLIKISYLDAQGMVDFKPPHASVRNIWSWEKVTGKEVPLVTQQVPFDHPLWIVYSSGTTGLPKPIVHGHGGIVVEQVKLLALHNDLGPEDRFYWFSSTGWVMWNLQIGGLLVGSTICLFDGNPGWPDAGTLWRFAGENGVTFFGAGAAFYTSCMKAGIEPRAIADLSNLRAIGSTGSPLPPEGYEWIYGHVAADIFLAPISGGTDIASAFIGGIPTLPVIAGEMQCRCLGADIRAFDELGNSVSDAVGELICAQPMPSMPLFFWGDVEGERYRDSYFDMYPGIWRHGDWVQITPRGGAVIYGRSDATINRQGIRMGTSELYRVVEDLPEVLDSLVVDLEYLGRESYMPLFVVLRAGCELNEQLKLNITSRIRTALSARHVPNDVFQVDEIPRTLSGKKLELPIKKLLLGQSLESVVNLDAVKSAASLDYFVAFSLSINKNTEPVT
ncbi:acetoacetate--CoA ligase [Pseudomonas putida]|uniref:Acetoacetate--CoA ligase n=1 Tax=Pseudomonas putida TaxID=303 RepID=A0AAW6Q1H1_PSEPU|nr:acetoacetate--CoA ligase [Pseudomonas putida]MDF3874557.1 acetoacetate--CoA ligase [Pseudomonas putida]MDF3880701.1 acetoacetate--CoA ligase [Pseudomonas putida]